VAIRGLGNRPAASSLVGQTYDTAFRPVFAGRKQNTVGRSGGIGGMAGALAGCRVTVQRLHTLGMVRQLSTIFRCARLWRVLDVRSFSFAVDFNLFLSHAAHTEFLSRSCRLRSAARRVQRRDRGERTMLLTMNQDSPRAADDARQSKRGARQPQTKRMAGLEMAAKPAAAATRKVKRILKRG